MPILKDKEVVSTPELRRLGGVLRAANRDVSALFAQLNQLGSKQLDAATDESISRVVAVATDAVANWMAGEGVETARLAGRNAGAIFGQLAIEQAAPLDEICRRALRWRDAIWQVTNDLALELGVDQEVRIDAWRMIQRSFDVTLVRLCEAFEAERRTLNVELELRQQELVHEATHDALTGLPNRTLILDRVSQMLARSRREHQPCGALFIDLDGFKAVNDGLGHRAGDELLCAVATRLGGVIREVDALGRLGGDEFVVLVEGLALAAGPELVAERLLDALKQPFVLEGAEGDSANADATARVTVTASIGIATGDRAAASDLLRDADIAMYRAKLGGKNRYVLYESGMQDAVHTRLELEMDLRDAVAADELFIAYQPMFELGGLEPVRMEALLRWQRPDGRTVAPDEFVPVLEESGLIVEVGRWVLLEACARCRSWEAEGHEIGVAVNVSAVQLDSRSFIDDVATALEESGLDPGMLTLEITETALMRDAEATAQHLREVKELGVRVSIDDFGTGYSSLAYLQQFPVDELKIDRSFVARLAGAAEGDALIKTFVQLGKSLSIETIAEGIEDPDQLSRLQAEDCNIGQGFLFARPMAPDGAEQFLGDWAPSNVLPRKR